MEREPGEEPSEEKFEWATNAPAHWPPVFSGVPPHPDAKLRREEALNCLAFVVDFDKALKAAGCELSFAGDRLTPEGVLHYPFEVQDGATRYQVFRYNHATEVEGAHFAEASRVLQEMGNPEPIYYAPAVLPQAAPGGALVKYLHPVFLHLDEIPPGHYSMWYPTAEPKLTGSKTLEHIRRAYESIGEYAPFLFAEFLVALEQLEPGSPATPLPTDMTFLPLRGPGEIPLVMSACQEKGVRLHLPHSTSVRDREILWELFANLCEQVADNLRQKNVTGQKDGGLEWFSFAAKVGRDQENKGEELKSFGMAFWNCETTRFQTAGEGTTETVSSSARAPEAVSSESLASEQVGPSWLRRNWLWVAVVAVLLLGVPMHFWGLRALFHREGQNRPDKPNALSKEPAGISSTALPPLEAGFESLFNGRDLSEWKGDDSVWTVENGMIVGTLSRGKNLRHSTCLIWRGGAVTDFEFRASFRLYEGNSGVFYRARELPEFDLGGYQFEVNRGGVGNLLDIGTDRARRDFIRRDKAAYVAEVDPFLRSTDWNDLIIIAKGNRIIQQLNGRTVAEWTDTQAGRQMSSGLLGLKLARTKPALVQFRNIRLKKE